MARAATSGNDSMPYVKRVLGIEDDEEGDGGDAAAEEE